jgi:hypothetical protein
MIPTALVSHSLWLSLSESLPFQAVLVMGVQEAGQSSGGGGYGLPLTAL